MMDCNNNRNPLTHHQCPNCHKMFTRASTLRNHLPSHTNERKFQCSVCGMKFNRSNDQHRHERDQHGSRRFPCNCGRMFGRKDALLSHQRSIAGQVCLSQAFESTLEGRTRDTSQQIGLMVQSSQSTPTMCSPAPSVTRELDLDINTLFAQTEDVDAATRATSTSASDEVLSNQSSCGYWSCQTLFTFRQTEVPEDSFERHLDSTKQCNVCWQKFLTDVSLSAHLTEHIVQWGIGPYVCPFCRAGFSFSIMLSAHLNSSSGHCQNVVTLWREGRMEELKWGCGAEIGNGEDNHRHQASCGEADRGFRAAENCLLLLVFEQLTGLWADKPEVVPLLDNVFESNKQAEDKSLWMKEEQNRLLCLLHEYIKRGSLAEPDQHSYQAFFGRDGSTKRILHRYLFPGWKFEDE